MRLSYRPERVRGALLGVAIVLTGLSIVAQLLTGPTGAALDSDYYGLSLLFNSAAEPSVANLYSALLLVVCAVMAGLCASAKRERVPTRFIGPGSRSCSHSWRSTRAPACTKRRSRR